jgi:hypothetical protein
MPKSRMHGAIFPLHQYAFMAWYSVKKEAQAPIYLYLYAKLGLSPRRRHIKLQDKELLYHSPNIIRAIKSRG